MSEAEVVAQGCPLSPELLPANMRKHVDPAAPVALRVMGAKGLVPLSNSDKLSMLFMLTFDAEASVRETALKTALGLPDAILASGFRDERLPPPVLAFFLGHFFRNDAYAEMLILNASTPDEAVARVAVQAGQRTAEIIAANQLRLLRHEDIVRQLALNPVTAGALIDGVCDFAVRSGLVLEDVPQMTEARVRLYGPQARTEPPPPAGPSADQVFQEFGPAVIVEGAPPLEEGKRLTFAQKVMKMNIAEKIKLATKGNKEARQLLLRDSNKLVAVAAIRSPRITDGEVLAQASNKMAHDDVLRCICGNREWVRQYPVKLALVKNPKVPQSISIKLVGQLHETDVKSLSRDKNVPGSVQLLAKKQLLKKGDKASH